MNIQNVKFNIKFITPLLIGSAENSSVGDSLGLTGKALRGAWRFWFRALVGGCLQTPDPMTIADLENKIFGSLKKNTFRLNIEPSIDNPEKPPLHYRLEHYHNPNIPSIQMKAAPFFSPVPPGSKFRITIIPRFPKAMSREVLEEVYFNHCVLLCTIWVWANLGSLGNRSRRGFGSVIVTNDSNFSGQIEFLMKKANCLDISSPSTVENFPDTPTLNTYITDNLTNIQNIIKKWITKYHEQSIPFQTSINSFNQPPSNEYYIMSSFDQLAIGRKFSQLDGINGGLNIAHGTKQETNDLGFIGRKTILGQECSRWASPVIIRFHEIYLNDEVSYVPLMIWCHQKGISNPTKKLADLPPSDPLASFRDRLGFQKSLNEKKVLSFD